MVKIDGRCMARYAIIAEPLLDLRPRPNIALNFVKYDQPTSQRNKGEETIDRLAVVLSDLRQKRIVMLVPDDTLFELISERHQLKQISGDGKLRCRNPFVGRVHNKLIRWFVHDTTL